jgi:hypothetical protein
MVSVEIATLCRRSGSGGATSLGKEKGSDSGGAEQGEASKEKGEGPSSRTRCEVVDGPMENPVMQWFQEKRQLDPPLFRT